MFDFTDIAFMTGIVMALAELLKRLGVPKKFVPIGDLILGLIAGFVYVAPGDPRTAILAGLIIGLSSAGLYSGAKNIVQGISKD